MRLPVRCLAFLGIVAVATFATGNRVQAQSSDSQSSSSSQTGNARATEAPTVANSPYIATNPLADVRYDNKYDLSLGMAYDHMKAGPTLLQGSNLGGLNLSGSMWFFKNWGLEGSGRAYVGTSGAAPNSPYNIKGPMVKQYFFVAGPEWLGPHNQHGAILAHIMAGGVYGNFQKDLLGQSPSIVDFYNNQIAPAMIVGGDFDLNRSPRWVFRITPDAVITHYSLNYAPYTSQFDVNFAISVGMEYKFKKKR
jgi:hypothetical protein